MSAAGTSARQQGQSGWMASQGRTQSEWYLCEHGSRVTRCRRSRTSSRHTAHTSTFDSVLVSSARRRWWWPPSAAEVGAGGIGQTSAVARTPRSAFSCCCSRRRLRRSEVARPSRSPISRLHLRWYIDNRMALTFRSSGSELGLVILVFCCSRIKITHHAASA